MRCPEYRVRPGRNFRVNEFLTPANPAVKRKAGELRGQNNLLEGVFNFVSLEIRYRRDKWQYGYEEWWTFPEKTLERNLGDCEDTSFLLASLLLAARLRNRDVRVVLGEVPGGGHAWVEVRTEEGWYLFESTSDSPLMEGRNMWEIERAYDIQGYSPELYIYKNRCTQEGPRGLYDRATLRY